jgi:hypothetical protein
VKLGREQDGAKVRAGGGHEARRETVRDDRHQVLLTSFGVRRGSLVRGKLPVGPGGAQYG